METKKRRFTRNLIALFLSVLMALSCFTGVLTAYAATSSSKDYHGSNLATNLLAWAETTDEQTAEALLDYADMYLPSIMSGLLGSTHISFNYLVISLDAYLDSVDGLIDAVTQIDDILSSYGTIVGGDVKNIKLYPLGGKTGTTDLADPSTSASDVVSQCGKSWRATNSAKDILLALVRCIEINFNNLGSNKNVLGNIFKGTFDMGTVGGIILKAVAGSSDLYEVLQDTFGMWDGYQYNLVYNIVANLILENTKWVDSSTKSKYLEDLQATSAAKRTYAFNFDNVLFDALNAELLNQIHSNITYSNMITNSKGEQVNDSSVERYKRICDAAGLDVNTADQTSTAFTNAAEADAQKYHYTNNTNIRYFSKATASDASTADFDKETGYVYIFQYATDTTPVELTKTSTLYSFAFSALKVAWTTVLSDTLETLHVNYNGHEGDGNGTNFDNAFYYWVEANVDGGWNTKDWTKNYSSTNVEAWANAVYADEYECSSVDEFLANVKKSFDYDEKRALQDVDGDGKYNWADVDSTSLFNRIRYSPLADKYFNIQTGPINLYFSQTGFSNLEAFFESAFNGGYDNIVGALNDALVAAVKDLFPDSDNICYTNADGTTQALSLPTLATTGNIDVVTSSTKAANIKTITSALVSNTMKMFEYAANATDANLLAPFYTNNGITTLAGNLTESNFEEAMLPLLISCLQNISATDEIHDAKWDSCKDAEGVAIVALEEYLSYVLPDKDYSVLWDYDDDGYIVAATDITNDQNGDNSYTLFDAILIMARDAVAYLVQSIVPTRDASGNEWSVYSSNVTTDKTTLLQILNSVIVYYASYDGYGSNTTNNGYTINNAGKAVASLLGVVNESGACQISQNNDIWTNLDNIVNTLLPIVGTVEFGSSDYAGKASTKTLIWEDLVNGILNIADTRSSFNAQGISNIVDRILTIVTSSPISSDGIDLMIYDQIVVPSVNAVFGGRYTNQDYEYVIPYSSWYDSDGYADTFSSTPFDAMLTTSTIGYYSDGDGNNTGVLGILVLNLYQFFGGDKNAKEKAYKSFNNDGAKGCWTGAMFAVEAVNNFIPSFVPQLSDHTIGAATASLGTPAITGATGGSAFTSTTLDITNGSYGLNRFYRDENGKIQQLDRYFITVKSVDVVATTELGSISVNSQTAFSSGTSTTVSNINQVVEPESSYSIPVSGYAPTKDTTYTFTVTYDIFTGEKDSSGNLPTQTSANTVYSNLTTKAYLYITTSKSWQDTLYSRHNKTNSGPAGGTCNWYDEAYEPDTGKTTEYVYGTARGGSKYIGTMKLYANLPYDYIVSMSNPNAVSDNAIRVRNSTNQAAAFDGIYVYPTKGTEYYAVTNKTESTTLSTYSADDNSVGYAAIDSSTGNILNYDLYDYYYNGTWYRGTAASGTTPATGYTSAEISALDSSIKDASDFQTRVHVAFTLDEAINSGLVTGVQKTVLQYDSNGDPVYSYQGVLMTPNTTLLQGLYDNSSKSSISWGTPTPGLYLATGKTDVGKSSSVYVRFISYDGVTSLEADSYTMAVDLYTTSNNNMKGTINMHICDDTGANTLSSAYDTAISVASGYSEDELLDYEKGSSKSYTGLQDAIANATSSLSIPITTSNAESFGSTYITEASTDKTTNELHKDVAYAPIETSSTVANSIALNGVKGTDGYYYWNEEQTMPIYTNVELSLTGGESTVNGITYNNKVTQKDGKYYDATGAEVAIGEDGKFHLVNAPVYETDWDTTTYTAPYSYETSTQATSNDSLLYKQISFVYRDTSGNKVNSDGAWVYKLAESSSVIKANPLSVDSQKGESDTSRTEYRDIYQRAIDNLTYWTEQLYKNVNSKVAQKIGAGVTLEDSELNRVNYNVAAYEKLVQTGNDAEDFISSVKKTVVTDSVKYGDVDGTTSVDGSANQMPTSYIEVKYDADSDSYVNTENAEDTYTADDVETIIVDFETTESGMVINVAYDLYKQMRDNMVAQKRVSTSTTDILAKLKKEITCATTVDFDKASYETTGYTYSDFTVAAQDEKVYTIKEAVTEYDEETGETKIVKKAETVKVTPYTITNNASDPVAEYGAYEDGVLVNTNYTDLTWDQYTAALGVAVETANDSSATVSEIYTAKTALQRAENNLEELEAEDDSTITVSGKLAIATDETGTAGEFGLVGVNITTEDGTVVATSADDGTFEAVVPAGTTSLIITGDTTIDRTVTLTGTADISDVTIGVVMCDYNDKDGAVNTTDAGLFTTYMSNYYVYADFNCDGSVNTTDAGLFTGFIGKTVNYTSLELD